MNYCIKFTQC